LQTQNRLDVFSVARVAFEKNAVPLWDPSQNGCRTLRPQAHHQYILPASSVTSMGDLGDDGSDSLIMVLPHWELQEACYDCDVSCA